MEPLIAGLDTSAAGSELRSPAVGVFRGKVEEGDSISPGRLLGTIRVLQRRLEILAPPGSEGVVVGAVASGPVEFGQRLVTLGEASEGPKAAQVGTATAAASTGYELRAPIDGIFYGRPSPEEPPFVAEGDVVSAGQTLGLVEVMKTFNPVRYGGAGAPKRGRVVSIAAGEQQEVAAGDLLFVIEPA